MTVRDFKKERTNIERRLSGQGEDFAATYLAVRALRDLMEDRPQIVNAQSLTALQGVLEHKGYASQTQAFFLYREAAEALVSLILNPAAQTLRDEAIFTLKHALGATTGSAQRAVAGALGSLPLAIRGPKLRHETVEDIPHVQWHEIMERAGVHNGCRPVPMGRSLVVNLDGENRSLVVKLARTEDSSHALHHEAAWMDHLRSDAYSFPLRFDVPVPIRIQDSYTCRLDTQSVPEVQRPDLQTPTYAVCFMAHGDYFVYPNGQRSQRRLGSDQFNEVMHRNAWLLGYLASSGIIHSASIPLFHNRMQGHRRDDHGLYEWPRAGRLDRWLASCSYPNFGLTGIRDFEHFVAFNGNSERLYLYIGSQVMSLLLVGASYFRGKDQDRVGLDEQGNPVDASDLFEETVLRNLVMGIFRAYYEGFVGSELSEELPLDIDNLISRMIEEMGVDRHMEEVLRVADQQRMSEDEFRTFLMKSGYPEQKIRNVRKGVEDITVFTGPHLGGFNDRTSLPELIEAVGTMSAMCVQGRYWKDNFSEPPHRWISSLSKIRSV